MTQDQYTMALGMQTVEEIRRLHQQIAAQRRYIEELEKQLEPSVVAEIRAELSEAPNETY